MATESNLAEGDILWPSFVPFWNDLSEASPLFLLMGGYAITLKQRWLLEDPSVEVLIPLSQWKDQTRRSSRDLDFIVSPEAIGSREVQLRTHDVLVRHGYAVVPARKRWQFEKKSKSGDRIKLDIQTFLTLADRTDVKRKDIRIKPRPSLKNMGFHGRINPDVPGGHLAYPSIYPGGVKVSLMNMVAHILMKVIAVHDRWERSLETFRPEEKRKLKASQAYKHAHDTCMIMAMLTPEDRESVGEIRAAFGSDLSPARAEAAVRRFFADDSSEVLSFLRTKWHPEHLEQIRMTLQEWFPS